MLGLGSDDPVVTHAMGFAGRVPAGRPASARQQSQLIAGRFGSEHDHTRRPEYFTAWPLAKRDGPVSHTSSMNRLRGDWSAGTALVLR